MRYRQLNTQLSSHVTVLQEDLKKERTTNSQLLEELNACRTELDSQFTKIENLTENLDTARSANSEQLKSLTRLREELGLVQEEENRAKFECESLRQKDTLRSRQLSDFAEKIKVIEYGIALCNERSSKLEAENIELKEQLEMYEMVFMQKTRLEKSKLSQSLGPEAAPSKKVETSPQILPLFSTSLDEPSMMETRSLLGPSDATEVPAPSPLDDKDFLKRIVPKRDVATSISDLAIISSIQTTSSQSNLTTAVTGSDLSLAASSTISNGRHSLAQSDFSRLSALSLGSRRRDEAAITDRSRLKELQRRNE
ncbi:unnamed protein product [Strongylus vulgaris]|uniref:Uncharacterized protein n=1 Tax=Strongylus vulgaris TaxID=40348 RepID=A0A3P7IP18_STRVU|nr:unnamed protein product [Strongylus vulgaris]